MTTFIVLRTQAQKQMTRDILSLSTQFYDLFTNIIFEGAKKLHCSKIMKKEQDEQDSTHGNYRWQ
jgi:hypothetical protein